MPAELREILAQTAATPSGPADVEALWRRGRERRRRRIVAGSIAVVAGLTIVAAGITFSLTRAAKHPDVSTPARPTGTLPGHGIVYRDTVNGLSVRVPPGWSLSSPCWQFVAGARRSSVRGCHATRGEISYTPMSAPQSTNGRFNTVLSAVDLPVPLPTTNVQCGFRPPASIGVREALPIGSITAPARPHRLGQDSGTGLQTTVSPPQASGCPAQTSITQNVVFSDKGRSFSVGVGFANNTSTQQQDQAYELLNSLRVLTETQLGRHAQTSTPAGHQTTHVTVSVLNGSATPGRENTLATALRNLGYEVVYINNTTTAQTGTTVACHSGFSASAIAIAKTIGPTTPVVHFPNPAPPEPGANCVVTITN